MLELELDLPEVFVVSWHIKPQTPACKNMFDDGY